MIEVRTYDGDAAELSRFVLDVWSTAYRGRMPVPLWDARYFDWQIPVDRPGSREFLVAAYDGSKLIGFLGGERFRFSSRDGEFDVAMASWTTADPAYAKYRIGARIIGEMRRRFLERGVAFGLGFGYSGAAVSMGPRFWRGVTKHTIIPGKIGFWLRLLDHRAFAAWESSRLKRWSAGVLGLVQGSPHGVLNTEGIRPYRADDLADCLQLTRQLLAHVDLGYVWTSERLAHQLDYAGLPRTIVLEDHGHVGGFVNYYRLDFAARNVIEAAVIDLVAFGALPQHDRQRLLRAALAQMQAEGLKAAMLLRLPCYPAWPLLVTGFVPMPRDTDLICLRADPRVAYHRVKRLHVHWR